MPCDVPQTSASMIRAASDFQKEAWFACELFIVSLRVLATETLQIQRWKDRFGGMGRWKSLFLSISLPLFLSFSLSSVTAVALWRFFRMSLEQAVDIGLRIEDDQV